MKVLVTGSSGLIGSEAVTFFDSLGFDVVGVDNNLRADFFGPKGDTTWNRERLQRTCERFRHVDLDIRDREGVMELFRAEAVELVVHTAAQPSHDLAASRPLDDYDVNATGTVNLLEACRRPTPDAVFAHFPGLKVVAPGTPADAKGLLKAAVRSDDPIFFIENALLYQWRGEIPEGDYTVPIGKSKIQRPGKDATIVSYSRGLQLSMQAADKLWKDRRLLTTLDLLAEDIHKQEVADRNVATYLEMVDAVGAEGRFENSARPTLSLKASSYTTSPV